MNPEPSEILRVLSLGAGWQSTTVALKVKEGELPAIDCAIFADTQSEPKAVYRHLEWLIGVLPFPVHVVTVGSLRQEILDACEGIRGAWGRPPMYIRNGDGSVGFTRRQCTQDYKLVPIFRKLRELAGVKPRSPGPKTPVVEQLIGISRDEAQRMKPAKFRWIRNSYPLVEAGITRWDCGVWLKNHGYPIPPKSACTFCPYHSDAMWRDIQRNDPESWADAVDLDRRIRNGKHHLLKGVPFLHSSCRPLEEVDFSNAEDRGQLSLFDNECEGMCGV